LKDAKEALREAENVVEALVRIAETDSCFVVRGTAVYVIGMVSGTEQGTHAQEELAGSDAGLTMGALSLFMHEQGASGWSGSGGTLRAT
jgi:hypothetical protein